MLLALYRLQQRLAITRQESAVLLTLAGLLALGLVVQQGPTPPTPDADVVRAARLAALATAAAEPPPADAPPVAHADAPEAAAPETAAPGAGPARAAATPERRRRAVRLVGPVDVNAASADDLQRLKGIGPALAGRILAHRAAHGPFRTVDDLQGVRGIGPKTVAKLRPHVVAGASG